MSKCEKCGKKVNSISKYWGYEENGVKKTLCSKCGEIIDKGYEKYNPITIDDKPNK